MPWHSNPGVASIAAQFLGGEGAGPAWVDVIFGDRAPAGRLPVMMPETEAADTIAPGLGEQVDYTEGMATSYRNVNFTAAFPFGHGLTYTTFEYNFAANFLCRSGARRAYCVSVEVTNNGTVAAKAVPQLYMQFPVDGLSQGAYGLLKGFQKTELIQPGTAVLSTFVLTTDEFSYYSADTGSWVQVTDAVAHIGESSSDIRKSLVFSQDMLGEMVATEPSVVV